MPKSTRVAAYFVLLLASLTLFTENSLVLGSPPEISRRPDPLRKFKRYNGDYDIRDMHYWASAAFTGIHGYAMAGIWLAFGLGCVSFMVLKHCSGHSSPTVYHGDSSYLILFLLVVLFTFFAIAATCVIIAANQKSLQRANKLKKTISDVGRDSSQAIRRVNIAFIDMQVLLQPYDPGTCHQLSLTTHRLRRESITIQQFVYMTRQSSDQAVKILYMANLVVVTVNLVFLVAGLVLLLLHCQPGMILIIFCCWVLTTLIWFLTGVNFFFYTFVIDTCSALENFVQNPQNNSLSNILPCAQLKNNDKTLVQIGYTVHSFIKEVNSKILEVQGLVTMNEQKDISIQEVCNPFSGAPHYSYTPGNCGNKSISVGDLPSVLSKFTCYNSSRKCLDDGRFLAESSYIIVWAYSQSIQGLIRVFPDLLSLMRCSFVIEMFSDIVAHQCKPLKFSVKLLWSSALSLSIFMMILVLLWLEKVIQDRGRCFSRCSIFPRPAV
ncbi:Hypothetical predicted protein [Olea europaea subsp. europaea]|uniref:Uncharacterized protein n=1 Tax=Olea europaea subsp. europaea TaxID=158383 RepID=A0A8S0URH9_OLEEU|nr:Hypothetical predicted protein [Olea europaea subsp. europaea]